MKKTKRAWTNDENKPLPTSKFSNCPKTLHEWSNESMLRALKVVKERENGVNRATNEYGVL